MWNVEYNTLEYFPCCHADDLENWHPFDWVYFKKKNSKKPGKVEPVFDIVAIYLIWLLLLLGDIHFWVTLNWISVLYFDSQFIHETFFTLQWCKFLCDLLECQYFSCNGILLIIHLHLSKVTFCNLKISKYCQGLNLKFRGFSSSNCLKFLKRCLVGWTTRMPCFSILPWLWHFSDVNFCLTCFLFLVLL